MLNVYFPKKCHCCCSNKNVKSSYVITVNAICYKNTNKILYLVLINMIKAIRTFRNSLIVCASLNETSVAAAMANKFLKPLIILCGAEAKVG